MLSHNQVKHITSLRVKKYREEYGQFIAEGHKLVTELLHSPFEVAAVYASPGWIERYGSVITDKKIRLHPTPERDMERITALSTPSPVLAVINIPAPDPASQAVVPGAGDLLLALDDIRDPGNLGTIIRIADWFGISQVLCSESCADLYNPKVVQATMGSIARVVVTRCNLAEVFSTPPVFGTMPVYGAFLEGESLFELPLTPNGIILVGNESRGISPILEPLVTKKIFIPSYGNSESGKAESLNASIATAIICAEFRKKLKINN